MESSVWRNQIIHQKSLETMNVAYFSNQFASASGHGIAHYAKRLYEGLRTFSDLNIVPVATGSDLPKLERQALSDRTGLKLLLGGRKMTPLAWLLLNSPTIESLSKESIDITHIVSLGFPVATRKKLVVTVHDIGPLTHPQYFTHSKPRLFKLSFDHMLRYADAIICVSQATANEVIAYAGEQVAGRIHVVHEGVDSAFFSREHLDPYAAFSELPNKEVPFFLAAGAMSPRKNIQRVVEAFKSVQRSIPHHLVLVGGKGWDSAEMFRLLDDPLLSKRVHHLGYVSDEQLQSLYKHADFYIHPSLFEGFGLTVLEAMAASCPVITSNVSSLPEVAGDAAYLVNPHSISEIAEAIEMLAHSDDLKRSLSLKGLERVKAFDWQNTARGVADIYRKVMS